VCVLIDPNYTAAAAAARDADELGGVLPEQDLKRLVQVVILGAGSIIGGASPAPGQGPAATREGLKCRRVRGAAPALRGPPCWPDPPLHELYTCPVPASTNQ
jgi:hypothetical protein